MISDTSQAIHLFVSYKFVSLVIVVMAISTVGHISHSASKRLASNGQVVFCESHESQYLECYIDRMIKRADLDFEISDEKCKEDVSWGYSAKYVWVKQDCRATFRVFASNN